MCNTRLGHVQLKVRNLDIAIPFYTKLLGLVLVERVGNQYAFLSNCDKHHELALQAVGQYAPMQSSHTTGLHHIAFEVPDQATFAFIYQYMVASGIQMVAVDHGISWSLYCTDPDGNGLEVYLDTQSKYGSQPQWRGRNLPLTPEQIMGNGVYTG